MRSAAPAPAVLPSQREAGRAPQGEWAHDMYKDKEAAMEPVARAQQQQQGPPPAQGSSYTGGGAGLCTVAGRQDICRQGRSQC